MRLPTQLSRRKLNAYKNEFGHILILAGSRNMLGAAALSGLAAMRSGAGLVTLGIPQSLNTAVQKKIAPVIMTLPLPETPQKTISHTAFSQLKNKLSFYQVIAVGPGLSQNKSTQNFIQKIVSSSSIPMVIDADGLNAVAINPDILTKTKTVKILTPHPGEMARLTACSTKKVEANRKKLAQSFAKKYKCTLLLKGQKTVVAAADGKTYINKTGNSGMATAGSGDVLTGMIAALLAQGLNPFAAAKFGAYLHGKAGDLAAKQKTQISMIAVDIIDHIPNAVKGAQRA